MKDSNKIVHGLWIGNHLSRIELLTIHSFIHHGHQFHLWLYDKLENELPENCVVRNANEIIPKEKIYKRKYTDPVGKVGKGSYALFSDWFRFKLLYDNGGWWTDMDITCLKPLNFPDDYVFREHDKLSVIGNLIKAPRHSELMKITSEKVKLQCNENTVDWLLSNKLFSETIQQLGLDQHIQRNISNRDIWDETRKFIFRKKNNPEYWYVIHWMNEEWRMRNISKDKIFPASTLGSLLYYYALGKKPEYIDRFLVFISSLR